MLVSFYECGAGCYEWTWIYEESEGCNADVISLVESIVKLSVAKMAWQDQQTEDPSIPQELYYSQTLLNPMSMFDTSMQ